jgi:hypothetical protein
MVRIHPSGIKGLRAETNDAPISQKSARLLTGRLRLYQVSESLTPAANSRIGIYLIHHGKQLSRGLPRDAGSDRDHAIAALACAGQSRQSQSEADPE